MCIAGKGELESNGVKYPIATGDAMLLPAEIGECLCRPAGEITLLECGLPS